MISDDIDLPAKSWRNKNPVDMPILSNKFDKSEEISRNENGEFDSDPFPQQSPNIQLSPYQLPNLNKSIQMKDESFSLPMYILLILTLAVIILFLNCYRKRRTRRNYFPFNRLGF